MRLTMLAVSICALGVSGCGYLGTARSFEPAELDADPGWTAVRGVTPILQETREDCGAAALAMILGFWGDPCPREEILRECGGDSGAGVRAGDLRELARRRGLRAYLLHGQVADLEHELTRGRPVLVGMVKPYATGGQCHYEVVAALHRGRGLIVTIDPAGGWRTNSLEGFMKEWEPAGRLTLVVFRAAGDPKTRGGE